MLQAIRQVIANFFGSEKAMAALGILAGATVLTATGSMTVAQWQETSLWILGIYTAGKTVQGAASALADSSKPDFSVLSPIVEAAIKAMAPKEAALTSEELRNVARAVSAVPPDLSTVGTAPTPAPPTSSPA